MLLGLLGLGGELVGEPIQAVADAVAALRGARLDVPDAPLHLRELERVGHLLRARG